MTTKLQAIGNKELRQVSGGWLLSIFLIPPFLLGAGIRYLVDPGAYK